MLLQSIINTLKSSQLSECNLKISMLNGKPTLAVMFDKAGAKATDNEAVQKLRECFTYPLVAQENDAETLEQVTSNELAHLIEELTIVSDAIDNTPASQKVANKRVSASSQSKKTKKDKVKETQVEQVVVDKPNETSQSKETVQTNETQTQPLKGDADLAGLFDLNQFSV